MSGPQQRSSGGRWQIPAAKIGGAISRGRWQYRRVRRPDPAPACHGMPPGVRLAPGAPRGHVARPRNPGPAVISSVMISIVEPSRHGHRAKHVRASGMRRQVAKNPELADFPGYFRTARLEPTLGFLKHSIWPRDVIGGLGSGVRSEGARTPAHASVVSAQSVGYPGARRSPTLCDTKLKRHLNMATTPPTETIPGQSTIVRSSDGVALSVREWGNPDGPEILLIHGFAQCHLCFVRQYTSAL